MPQCDYCRKTFDHVLKVRNAPNYPNWSNAGRIQEFCNECFHNLKQQPENKNLHIFGRLS